MPGTPAMRFWVYAYSVRLLLLACSRASSDSAILAFEVGERYVQRLVVEAV